MRILRHIAVLTLLVCLESTLVLFAQSESGATLTGNVRDQSGTPIAKVTVSLKDEGRGSAYKTTTDAAGHYSITGLPASTYTVEVSSPNFSTSRHQGVKLTDGAKDEFSTALALAALPQTITVEGNISVAAEMAPSQSSLEARSAQSRISGDFVENFTSPVADYTEVLNMAPGTFGVNPNRVGLGR
jgi:iron complex outermembrane receptor protein